MKSQEKINKFKEIFSDFIGGYSTADFSKTLIRDILADEQIETGKVYKEILDSEAERQIISNISDVAVSSGQFYNNISKRTENLTGFYYLDKYIDTIIPSEIFLLAARSGIGKTNAALHFSKNIKKSTGKPVLFFSLEMSRGGIYFRQAGITLCQQQGRALNSAQIRDFLQDNRANRNWISSIMSDWNGVFVVDKPGMDSREIERYIEAFKNQYGEPGAVIIDYLGYIQENTGRGLYEKTSNIARNMKELAKRQQVRIFLLCQTSRLSEDGTKEIESYHLRDSGVIEESCDYCLGMWKDKNEKNRIHCKIMKNRNGESGIKFDLIQIGVNYEEEEFNTSTTPAFAIN